MIIGLTDDHSISAAIHKQTTSNNPSTNDLKQPIQQMTIATTCRRETRIAPSPTAERKMNEWRGDDANV
eukprot:scaffold585053_cov18-Prasinocladus_malaysianus.AAC.1